MSEKRIEQDNCLYEQVEKSYINSLKNRFFEVLCVKEERGDWEKYLDSLVIEINDIYRVSPSINLSAVIHKMAMLKYLNYKYFRKTIFECMNLL